MSILEDLNWFLDRAAENIEERKFTSASANIKRAKLCVEAIKIYQDAPNETDIQRGEENE